MPICRIKNNDYYGRIDTTLDRRERNMSIESMLREEIVDEFEGLKDLELGSQEHKVAVEAVSKLMDKAIEMDKNEAELQDKIDSREAENDFKEKQLACEKKDRNTKNLLTVLGVVASACLTIWGTLESFEFEKEGTITTIMGRGYIGSLLPKKK